MTSRDFDWDQAERQGCVVQPTAYAVAVYTGAHNHIIIRQEGAYGGLEDDCWIELHATHVPAVVQALIREAGLEPRQLALPAPSHTHVRTDEREPAPSAAAERAKRYRERKKRQERDGVTQRRDANGTERDGVPLAFDLTG